MKIFRIFYKILLFLLTSIFFVSVSIVPMLIVLIFGNAFRRKFASIFGKAWSKTILFFLCVKVEKYGHVNDKDNGVFFASNHLSYLDILVLYSKFRVVFVSKQDVKKWPIIGLLARYVGTIFIDRSKKTKAKEYVKKISELLKKRVNILFFPEGTSSVGDTILPFKTSLFEAPLETQGNIQPVFIKYNTVNKEKVRGALRDKVCWYGDLLLTDHIIQFLGFKSVKVSVYLADLIKFSNQDKINRKILSNKTYDSMIQLKQKIDSNSF